MNLLKHRSTTAPEHARDDRGRQAHHVRVVPPPAVDEDPTQVFDEGPTEPIEALLRAVADGDREALAALERRLTGLVRVNIRRVLRDAACVDAMTQQFFAEVLQDLATFDPTRDSAQSWLLTRAHQRATDGLAVAGTASSSPNVGRVAPVERGGAADVLESTATGSSVGGADHAAGWPDRT